MMLHLEKKFNLEKENESYASEKGVQVQTCSEEKGYKRSVNNMVWRKPNLRTKCLENPRFKKKKKLSSRQKIVQILCKSNNKLKQKEK